MNPSPALRTNILANYAGQAWAALMALAFVPCYLRVLGAEAFGLVGLMLSLQTLTQLLEVSVGGAANRELARRAHANGDGQSTRDLVRTLEALVWPIALAIAAALWLASPLIAGRWLHLQRLDVAATTRTLSIMAVAVACFWPASFYASALSGLERQVSLNLVTAVFATLRFAGAVPVLMLAPNIDAFLAWHALVGIAHALVGAATLWRALPPATRRVRVHWQELRGLRRFAGGLFAIGALALALSQLDRLALSALRPLAELGYYALAMSVAAGMGRMVQPMFNAMYPRFSRLVASGEHQQLVTLYHLGNQFLATVVFPVAFVLVLFARDVLLLWTGDAEAARIASVPMAMLVAGSALSGLLNLPFALQLAHGWTRLVIAAHTVALIVALPLGLAAIQRYGMTGAAAIWLTINVGYFLVVAPMVHRRLVPGEQRRWYVHDLLPAFAATAATAVAARLLVPALTRDLAGLLTLATVGVTVLLAATLATAAPRTLVLRWAGLARATAG